MIAARRPYEAPAVIAVGIRGADGTIMLGGACAAGASMDVYPLPWALRQAAIATLLWMATRPVRT